PTTTDRHEDRVQLAWMLAQDFHGYRALASNGVRVIIGMDEYQPLLLHLLLRVGQRLVKSVAVQHHLAAPRPYGLDLDLRRGPWHHDGRLHPHMPRRECQPLGMVTRGCGDHATGTLLVGQLLELVVGATDLEGEHRLQVLALEQHGVAKPLGKEGGTVNGGFDGDIVDRGTEDLLYVTFQSRHRDSAW